MKQLNYFLEVIFCKKKGKDVAEYGDHGLIWRHPSHFSTSLLFGDIPHIWPFSKNEKEIEIRFHFANFYGNLHKIFAEF